MVGTYAFYDCYVKRCLLLKDCQVLFGKELHDDVAPPLVLSQPTLHQLRHSLAALKALELLRVHSSYRRAASMSRL